MTNFFYGGNLKENERFVNRRYYPSYGIGGLDYESTGTNTDCDFCHDIYERTELIYVLPEDDDNADPDKIAWTVKLCCTCLNVIVRDHDILNYDRHSSNRNENRRMQRNNL